MDIYTLRREEDAGVDEAYAFVVIAPSELEARKMAAQGAGDEGAYPWAFEAAAVKAGTAVPGMVAGILLRGFNSGG
jgi:hypothetical protein